MDPRSKRVRKEIISATARLFEEGGFDELSVSNICIRAEVSRSGFYAHYQSADECLVEVLSERFSEIETGLEQQRLDPDSLLLDKRPLSYIFLEHISSNAELYAVLFKDPRGFKIVESIRSKIQQLSYQFHQPLRDRSSDWDERRAQLVAAYLSGALLASAKQWALSGFEEDCRVMAYWFSSLAAPGLLQSMGIES
jgi:AcrR family transcriptional regulator